MSNVRVVSRQAAASGGTFPGRSFPYCQPWFQKHAEINPTAHSIHSRRESRPGRSLQAALPALTGWGSERKRRKPSFLTPKQHKSVKRFYPFPPWCALFCPLLFLTVLPPSLFILLDYLSLLTLKTLYSHECLLSLSTPPLLPPSAFACDAYSTLSSKHPALFYPH